VGSGPIAMAALASGDIQVAYSAGPPTVNAILAGGDVRVFGGYLDRMPYQVVARPDIRTIADLRGQTIGINRFGGAAEFVSSTSCSNTAWTSSAT
jgi:ABC-type nitrate/sulfonate/bicarbonate transport system substrate-binding protein